MNSNKEILIHDIEQLLNSYDGISQTQINPELLSFMDETTLKSIISDLLDQKERVNDENREWLEQFKTHQNE